MLFGVVAVLAPFEAGMDRLETTLGFRDIDDISLWLVLPCALLVALQRRSTKPWPRP